MSDTQDSPDSVPSQPSIGVTRNVTIVRGKGADVEWSILRSKIDFIYEGVCQPVAFLLLGVAATSAVEAYNANAGTEHRHIYVIVAIAGLAIALVAFFADWKIRHESHRQAGWVREYMERSVYADVGAEPPAVDAGRRLKLIGRLRQGASER
jgi:hypothetical protein